MHLKVHKMCISSIASSIIFIQSVMKSLRFWVWAFFLGLTEGLYHCNDKHFDKLSICQNVQTYDKSFPGDPIKVYNSLTVLDVVEFNPDDNTITLFVQIMVMWNDTRLTLTTGNANE